MTPTQAALLEAQSIRAIVAKMRADLTAVGGFDNELLGVPAGGVRAHIEAMEAALSASEAAQPEPVARRSALEDECARTDSLLTILGLSAEQCRTEGGSLQPRKVLELLADARAKATPAPLHEVMRHVRRLMAHVDSWTRWYGQADVLLRHQLPLPPAGTVHILEDLEEAIRNAAPPQPAPIDMVLHCPACGMQHIDAPEDADCDGEVVHSHGWENPPHRSHLCHGCGHIWRPADVPTNGVAAVKTKGKEDSPIPQPAPIAAQAGAPTIKAAHDMGAKGGPAVEAERLAFEAWMRGHCWALGADWTGTEYRCDSEQSGRVSLTAMRTRQLWAAWRDRAALAAQAAPTEPVTMPSHWSVSVTADGDTLVSIGNDWLSGSRDLTDADERTIIGAAQHLLSFVGYGLPPCTFDPDADDAAQAGPALVPLTDDVLLKIAREHAGTTIKLTRDVGPYEVTEPTHVYRLIARAIERAHGIGAQAPESTRPADASILGQRIDMLPPGWKLVPVEPTQEMQRAAFDELELIGTPTESGTSMRNRVYRAMLAAAPQAPAEQRTVSLAKLNDTTGHSNGGEMWGGYGSFWLTTTTDVMPAEPAAQAVRAEIVTDPAKITAAFERDDDLPPEAR